MVETTGTSLEFPDGVEGEGEGLALSAAYEDVDRVCTANGGGGKVDEFACSPSETPR